MVAANIYLHYYFKAILKIIDEILADLWVKMIDIRIDLNCYINSIKLRTTMKNQHLPIFLQSKIISY